MTTTKEVTEFMVEHKQLPLTLANSLPTILEEMETGKATHVQIAAFITALFMVKRKESK